MYHCVCHTCEEDETEETLEAAQEFFNEHAKYRHEVELQRLDEQDSQAPSAPNSSQSQQSEQPGDP